MYNVYNILSQISDSLLVYKLTSNAYYTHTAHASKHYFDPQILSM